MAKSTRAARLTEYTAWKALDAHSRNIQGTVYVHIQIGADGRVLVARGQGTHPYLVKAAEDNVRQWVFGPFPPRGEYPIYHTVTYVYKLEGKPAAVFFYPPVVRTALPDRVEIQTRPFFDDLVAPTTKSATPESRGTK